MFFFKCLLFGVLIEGSYQICSSIEDLFGTDEFLKSYVSPIIVRRMAYPSLFLYFLISY